MRLADVLKNAGIETLTGSQNPGDTEITGITLNSQNVEPGSLFIAIRGKATDGHMYAASAVKKGAAALLLEEVSEEILGLGVPVAKTSDSRTAASIVASNFHDHPSLAMKVVGVTGTNGKTTVSHMIEAGWKAEGINTGLLGTIENRYMGKTEAPSLTTPDPIAFMSMLREMKDAGVTTSRSKYPRTPLISKGSTDVILTRRYSLTSPRITWTTTRRLKITSGPKKGFSRKFSRKARKKRCSR